MTSAGWPGVEELRRAWDAVAAGVFRSQLAPVDEPAGADELGPVVVVVGAHGGSGASTMALALAEQMGSSWLVDVAPAARSGLVSASTTELGDCDGAWSRGLRTSGTVIDRLRTPAGSGCMSWSVPGLPPRPDGVDAATVVDVGLDMVALLERRGWVPGLVGAASTRLVVTAVASIPGIRRLEAALALTPVPQVAAVVMGPPVRKWPRSVRATAGPCVERLIDAGGLVNVPEVPELRVLGVTGAPLPAVVMSAAARVVGLLDLSEEGLSA